MSAVLLHRRHEHPRRNAWRPLRPSTATSTCPVSSQTDRGHTSGDRRAGPTSSGGGRPGVKPPSGLPGVIDQSGRTRPTVRRTTATLTCQGQDADLFFAERPEEVETAKGLCRSCPVRSECLADARSRRGPWGFWGWELFLGRRGSPSVRGAGRAMNADHA
ncbi:MAG: WhiB family transcriptional regulator [Nocardioidaceae bacterium]